MVRRATQTQCAQPQLPILTGAANPNVPSPGARSLTSATSVICRRTSDLAHPATGLIEPIGSRPKRAAHSQGACRMTVKITPNDKGNPPGKLAEAELHFTEGCLEGLKLIGFSIWERRSGTGRNVTFPARSYSVNGERRSFALLRPIVDTTAQYKLREFILAAFQEYEERAAITT
jgi:hypothetical protein